MQGRGIKRNGATVTVWVKDISEDQYSKLKYLISAMHGSGFCSNSRGRIQHKVSPVRVEGEGGGLEEVFPGSQHYVAHLTMLKRCL